MTKYFARIFPLALVLCLSFSMLASGQFSDVEKGNVYDEAVTVLNALGIINGYEDGSFRPEAQITRAELCAIMSRVLNRSDNGKAEIFSDVNPDHWACGYIAQAYQAGIVNGVGDSLFKPEDYVTYEHAVKMTIEISGFGPIAEASGGYPTGYMIAANQKGITAGTVFKDGAASRGTVSKIIFNALTVDTSDFTLLYKNLNVIKVEAKITSFLQSGANLQYTDNETELPPTISIEGVDVSSAIGLTSDIYIDISGSYRLLAAFPKQNVKEIKTNSDLLINKNDNGYIEYYKNETDDILTKDKISESLAVYNNLAVTKYDDVKVNNDNPSEILYYRYVDTDNDNIFDTVFIGNK